MSETFVNTFTGGMDKDTDFSLLAADRYVDALGLRLTSYTGNSNASLENVKGTTDLEVTSATVPDQLEGFIVGSINLRDDLIVFTSTTSSTTPETVVPAVVSRIYKFVFNEWGTIETCTLLYDDSTATNKLYLSTAYKITGVSRYETDDIQKVYWTDRYHNIRYCNIADPNLSTPLEADKFDFLYNSNLVKPSAIGIGAGNLQAGKIQYAYQLYNINGSETAFSPCSELYHITSSAETAANSSYYIGSEKGTDTGKGFRVYITGITEDISYIRIVAIQYDALGGVPTIRIVEEKPYDGSGSVTTTDTGQYIGDYTLEQFTILSSSIFTCQDIAVKNDYMFTANVTEQYFDVDYDARAFRFNSGTNNFYLTDGVTSTLYTYTGDWTTTTLPPEDDDAINLFNNISNDGAAGASYTCKYRAGTSTFGGDGPNVSYYFTTYDFNLDNDADRDSLFVTTAFSNYANPFVASNYLGYQRDEIYRFGIVFFDNKGRQSFVKWIADIRIPSNDSLRAYLDTTYVAGSINGKAIGLVFNVNNLPADVVSYQIVRAKREEQDKTVLANGILSKVVTYGAVEYRPSHIPDCYDVTGTTLKDTILNFISPEISYLNNLEWQADDMLYVEGYLNQLDSASTGGPAVRFNTKYKQYNAITQERKVVQEGYIANGSPWVSPQPYTFSGDPLPYYHTSVSTSGSNAYSGPTGRDMVLRILTGFSTTGLTDGGRNVHVASYRRPRTKQYGGNTYSDRALTVYYPCSNLFTKAVHEGVDTTVYGGDTYIGFFDHLRVEYDTTSSSPIGSFVYFPIESSVNMQLGHGWQYHNKSQYAAAYALHESKGAHESAGVTLEQEKDYYEYNTVYSQENNTKSYVVKPIVWTDNTTYDCRVKYSNKKINGEAVDSWTKFNVNNFLDVDASYGYVNNIKTFRDKLLFWQKHATGVLAVNDRVLIDDNNPGGLVLGTGGVLTRYDYYSTFIGNIDNLDIVQTDGALYWIDRSLKEAIKFSDGIEVISKTKRIQSYLNSKEFTEVFGAFDRVHNEVLFSFGQLVSELSGTVTPGASAVVLSTTSPNSAVYYNLDYSSAQGQVTADLYNLGTNYNARGANATKVSATANSITFKVNAAASQGVVNTGSGFQNYGLLRGGDTITLNITVAQGTETASNYKAAIVDQFYTPVSNEVTLANGTQTVTLTIPGTQSNYVTYGILAFLSRNGSVSNGNITITFNSGTATVTLPVTDSTTGTVTFSNLGFIPNYTMVTTTDVVVPFTEGFKAGNTLVYNELIDGFTGFFPYYPALYIQRYNTVLSSSTLQNIWLHNDGDYGVFYNTGILSSATPFQSSISIVVNDKPFMTKVFDNIMFQSIVTNINGVNIYNDTFDVLNMYNDHQNTGDVTLTYNSNIRRREREWTLAVPRNAVNVVINSNPDIQDSTNFSLTRLFRERMRGPYVIENFKYNNTNNYKFSVPYIINKYRSSIR